MQYITMLHKNITNPEEVNKHGWDAAKYSYDLVAKGRLGVETRDEALEYAYMGSQNIDFSWTKNMMWSWTAEPDMRSTMVGDLVVVNDYPFQVADIGFKEVDNYIGLILET